MTTLLTVARRLGLDPQDLDDLVHTLKEEEAADKSPFDDEEEAEYLYELKGDEAARINNNGLTAQIRYIQKALGRKDGERIIRRISEG